jgi:hypothetical protein
MGEFYVEDVLAKAFVKGQPFYKVKWRGYSFMDCTW